uniref:ATP synthase subunit b, chloroplastic n=1 Tax=Pseudobryopsis hainanensis TaxID=2320808 RepID=A0A386AXV2_9CHLO|nr:ATP synthase CF0 subunit I [Pseudobryopsis hainanensis]
MHLFWARCQIHPLVSTPTFLTQIFIGIVVSFVGDALKSLLENRQQTVIFNLQEAQQRAQEAQKKLIVAREQLESARSQAKIVHEQSESAINQEKQKLETGLRNDVARLQAFKQSSLALQKQRAVQQVSKQVITLALKQVRTKLTGRYDRVFQTSVNNFYVALLRNYQRG